MRLWHWKILNYLPDGQLISQWRELNSIFRKQPKHILINYVYEYPKYDLLAYSMLVMYEMTIRHFRYNTSNWEKYFEGVYIKDIKNYETFTPFENHHNNRYLLQCFYNLQEKYDRGQKDFSKERFDKLVDYVKWIDD